MSFRPPKYTRTMFDKSADRLWAVGRIGRAWIVAILHGCQEILSRICGGISPALILGLLSAVLGTSLVWAGVSGIDGYLELISPVVKMERIHREILINAGIYNRFSFAARLFVGGGLFLCAMSVVGLLKLRLMHRLHKAAVAAGILGFGYLLYYLVEVPATLRLFGTVGKTLVFDKHAHHSLLIVGIWGWGIFAVLLFWYAVTVAHGRSLRYYSGIISPTALWGDRVTRSVRTGGEDPPYKESTRWSIFAHIFLLFILPLLLGFRWMQAYEIPKGSGVQAPQVVQVVKKKKKKQEKMVFNPNSAISFLRPDIDESKVLDEVMVETEAQYEVTSLATGKLGQGGGKKGGWPNGMENARVRFIRLEYAGGNWDQAMGGGADYNFLLKFSELTGFKIAKQTESIRIRDLRGFPKKKAPPFVYLTGGNRRDGFSGISISTQDAKTLRGYLLEEGGMIFADNGGDGFDSAFRSMMRRALPDSQWIDIANDDILYRQPYLFPDGAPKIQSHSGSRGLGIKDDDGRWIVFYHQGDLKDAWKDGGSGFSKSVQMSSFKMGINVVNYSFNQYLSIHYGD
ncbi:MAG: hypothetical protein ACI8W8_002078 [Rhodothermales bacterium]|jgi:hypothetical protein